MKDALTMEILNVHAYLLCPQREALCESGLATRARNASGIFPDSERGKRHP